MAYVPTTDPNTPSDLDVAQGAAAELRFIKLRQQTIESEGNSYTDLVVQQAISEYQALIAPPTTAAVGGTVIAASGQQVFVLPVVGFNSATVYINGVHQALTDVTADGVAGTLTLIEPVYKDDVVSYVVGSNDDAILALNASVQPAQNTLVQRTATGGTELAEVKLTATTVIPPESFYIVMQDDATDILVKATRAEFVAYLGLTKADVSTNLVFSDDSNAVTLMPAGAPTALGFEVTTATAEYSDFIPVVAGEAIFAEWWLQGDGASTQAYLGLERYDKDKKPVAINQGTQYFTGLSNVTLPASWTKYTSSITLPVSHVPYNGSDGNEVRFIKVRQFKNYQTSTTDVGRYAGLRIYRKLDNNTRLHLTDALRASGDSVILARGDGTTEAVAFVATASARALHSTDALRASGISLQLVRGNGASELIAVSDLIKNIAVNSIGSYCFAKRLVGSTVQGGLVAGSSLYYSNTGDAYSGTLAGTWRCMGRTVDGAGETTLWLRVS